MKQYGEYVTKEGDMWDAISYELYGSENGAGEIIELNPQYCHEGVLPSGIVLKVPLRTQYPQVRINETLPPWKK